MGEKLEQYVDKTFKEKHSDFILLSQFKITWNKKDVIPSYFINFSETKVNQFISNLNGGKMITSPSVSYEPNDNIKTNIFQT